VDDLETAAEELVESELPDKMTTMHKIITELGLLGAKEGEILKVLSQLQEQVNSLQQQQAIIHQARQKLLQQLSSLTQ